jgi:D-xylose 1-dehydrogenase (NADP+, D-xylono-1,5-lactone-forming)
VTVQWGILSTARINDKFVVGCAQTDAVNIAAVASRDRERARLYADEHGIERSYGSYEELLADPELQAVYISLPNALHLPWTERALRAGKHVLCEKPLSRRPEEVKAAFDLAQAEGRLLMEAFMYRHNPQTQRAQELVRSGAVGRLRLIRAAFSFPVADARNVRLSAGLDGGALMDVGCYCVSAVRMLGGEPREVTAQQMLGGDGVDVIFTGTMRTEHDVLAHFDAGLIMAGRDELELVGEAGSLFLDDPWHCRRPRIELRTDDGVQAIELARVDSYMLEAEDFSQAIAGQGAPLLGRDDAVGQATAIAALYRAAEGGGTVLSDVG